jgi:hypothetical protein
MGNSDDEIKACTKCGSEHVLHSYEEIDFMAQIPEEKMGYGGTMSYHMKISVSWCMKCGILLKADYNKE